MGNTSRDLLHLEHKNSSPSPLESTLLVCNKKDSHSQTKKPNPDKEPITAPLPKSQVLHYFAIAAVLGKVKDFLGVISEANKRLELDAKDNGQDYDIEVLTGNESEVIEMDLMLGVADLQTPEAVAAAEAAIAGHQPVIPLAVRSSGSELEGSSDGSELEHSCDDDDDSDDNNNDHDRTCSPVKQKRSESSKEGKNPSKKRSKIVELS